MTRFQDKAVVSWGARLNRGAIISWRGAILSVPVYYLSVSLQFLEKRERERNLDCKGGNFSVDSLCREVLLC